LNVIFVAFRSEANSRCYVDKVQSPIRPKLFVVVIKEIVSSVIRIVERMS